MERPLILISNDDGYQAKGINSLIDMIAHLGDIIVCAPEDARSGFSRAFSATTPLRLQLREKRTGITNPLKPETGITNPLEREQGKIEIWSSNGTPVDCVKLALSEIVPRKPDLIIGGINHGDNGSVNSHYSGTMGVVMEGCMKYIPSVAYSLCDHNDDADFEPLRPYITMFTERVLHEGLPTGVCLNINFPLQPQFKGIKICRMAHGTWGNEISRCHHPRGYDYYWMVGHYQNDEPQAEDTDNWALNHGYVAITPTTIDLTAYDMLHNMEDWTHL